MAAEPWLISRITGLMVLVEAVVLELYIWILRVPAADAVFIKDTLEMQSKAMINKKATILCFKKIFLLLPALNLPKYAD
jgi:hypothetical protein